MTNRCQWSENLPPKLTRQSCGGCGRNVHRGDILRCRMSGPVPLSPPKADKPLVGTALKTILEGVRIPTGVECGCQELAAEMDHGGIQWCEANREYIVCHLLANRTSIEAAPAYLELARLVLKEVASIRTVADLRLIKNLAVDPARTVCGLLLDQAIRAEIGRCHVTASPCGNELAADGN